MSENKMEIDVETARELALSSPSKDFTEGFRVVENKISGRSRWSIEYNLVVQREFDKKFFSDVYKVGATESQDEQPFEFSSPNFIEVLPQEFTATRYIPIQYMKLTRIEQR